MYSMQWAMDYLYEALHVLVTSGDRGAPRGALIPASVPEWGTALSGPVGHVNPRTR